MSGTVKVEIDAKLIADAKKVSGLATKKAIVEEALRLMIKLRRQTATEGAFGAYRWRGNLDLRREGRIAKMKFRKLA